jgi:hypothetical protein
VSLSIAIRTSILRLILSLSRFAYVFSRLFLRHIMLDRLHDDRLLDHTSALAEVPRVFTDSRTMQNFRNTRENLVPYLDLILSFASTLSIDIRGQSTSGYIHEITLPRRVFFYVPFAGYPVMYTHFPPVVNDRVLIIQVILSSAIQLRDTVIPVSPIPR